MNFKLSIIFSLLVVAFTSPYVNSQDNRCENYDSVISNLYTSIEALNVKKLKSINEYLKLHCADNDIEIHLLFSELTIADAENDRSKIELLRDKITASKILDKSNSHFVWHLYVLAQSWFWDTKSDKAVSLLSEYNSYFISEPKNPIEVRVLSLIGGYFNNAKSSIEKEKNDYFDKAEIKANEIGDPELKLYVNFRRGGEAFPDSNTDSAVEYKRKKDKWMNMLDSVDPCVTKAEVMLFWGYLEVEEKQKNLTVLEGAIQILSEFGVTRTVIDGSMLYIELLIDYGEASKAESMIKKLIYDYADSLDSFQKKQLYGWLFELSSSQERYEDALKYKDEYYLNLIAKDDKTQKKLDQLLLEYKVEEQKAASKMLKQSLQLIELETENEKQKNYILILFVITLSVALFLFSIIIYRGRKSKIELQKLAMIDSLTGAWNRRAITLKAAQELAMAQRKGHNLTILLADLDDFKSVNDIYGHDVGDLVLKTFANIASDNMRANDQFGRWGGEEWLFILPATSMEEAKNLFNRLSDKLSKVKLGDLSNITFSMGAVEFSSERNIDLNSLIKEADKQLYVAKEMGKNRVCFASR
ncbi:GGDEF domain-containing protein [Pseudoalteromonas sp. CR1]|uniref:GGDEF domain-containing protein n=1 Tax=Pseudoalteromonas sp. CR1 TaxID=2861964 RepID=UPI001C5E996D|nr:GGDEF domain-containing protein [Pseudoalteromonas sp. CR1]MBW4966072.1 GGDEF domain-containing protein [Pseudoalteromonas sp. CR1]